MKSHLVALALSSTLIAFPAAAQAQVGKSAPVQQRPVGDATPLPADTPWHGEPIRLDIDATDTTRGVYRVTQTIPVPRGMTKLSLLLPEWLPGNHAPRGTINLIADIRFTTADGAPLEWVRNPLDVYQIDVIVPQGTRAVVAQFVHTSPITGREGRITMTQEMLNLQWEKMSFYPAGHYTRRIAVKPQVTFPAGWQVFTALDGMERKGDTIGWDQVDYETLVDSPIFAGKHSAKWAIGKGVQLTVVADEPGDLDLAPEHLATFEKLVDEADALFGARPFDDYTFLLALTDRMGGIGLEHHRSSENQYEPKSLVDWDKMDWDRNVVPHELVHSWNGKFRRPVDLWTPDYRTPMQDTLLWVYEGQTQFWGYVLAARSGLQRKETVLGMWARAAALYSEGQPGRAWRAVEDTTHDPIINSRAPLPFSSLSRSEDYYVEGALVWLEADQIIRQGTSGAKGLDDFARAFFGKNDGDWGEVTYDFDEVVAVLNSVHRYDWANFLKTRIYEPGQPAPLKGIEAAGYRLVWKDTPNPFDEGRTDYADIHDLTYSLGLALDSDGIVVSTLWDGLAFKAGIVNGTTIVAVNGESYSAKRIDRAITAAKEGGAPIALLTKRGDRYDTVEIDYRGGLRYPWLEPVGDGEQGLDRLLAARSGN
jgi:predicted metalloprotease with PDZ domain